MADTVRLELARPHGESVAARWYRAHASTIRGLVSLVVVGAVWEAAGRSGRWPLILAPLSEIWTKFLQLSMTGELQHHALVSLNEFVIGFGIAAALGIALGIAIAVSDPVRDVV